MTDYTRMSAYYDLIMTSGYYDYDAIADQVARFDQVRTVLEIGSGTGLILERLVNSRPEWELAGIDLTQAMLDIAARRLDPYPEIAMHRQDIVSLSLEQSYDLAFSYGGVWYFVDDEDGFSMISHIRDREENQQGFERLAAHLHPGATLLLGIQAPHVDYARPVANGMEYAQRIISIPGGFRKHYTLTDDGLTVMEQTTDYRTYPFAEAIELLDKCGFEYCNQAETSQTETSQSETSRAETSRGQASGTGEPAPLFLEFSKR